MLLATILLLISSLAWAGNPAGADQLSDAEWASVEAQIQAHRHRAIGDTADGYRAGNADLGLAQRYHPDGRTRIQGQRLDVSLQLKAYGYGQMIETATPTLSTEVDDHGGVVHYQWDQNLREWWLNRPGLLEQWFELQQRPPGADGSPLQLRMALEVPNETLVHLDTDGQALRVGEGEGALHYAGLKVWDADGHTLFARMQLNKAGDLLLSIDDANARYPITIDPTWSQQAYFKASNTDAGDEFGFSVAISGDTLVVGAPREDSDATGVNGNQTNNNALNSGAAYVFSRAGVSNWSQQAYLKASNTGAGDLFGYSVAISGRTLVIGAPFEDSDATGVNGNSNNNTLNSGAAYVFVRSCALCTQWSQQAYLKASNTGFEDNFGHSVALSGDELVIGAPGEDSNATGVNGDQTDNSASRSGAAYVFRRNNTTWFSRAYLKASNTEAEDSFGTSVAISGYTVVVGAHLEDSSATGVNGDQADNSAQDSGAVYVFGGEFGLVQEAYLKASNTGTGDQLGYSVAISGSTLVVGAFGENSNAIGVNGNQADNSATNSGAAYVFVANGTNWSQQAYLKASNTEADDQFGVSTAISGNLLVVGANREDSSATGIDGDQANNSATNSGAAYLFTRSEGSWTQQAHVKASNTDPSDIFGSSVTLSSDTLVVGAHLEDGFSVGVNGNQSNGATSSGAAYGFLLRTTIGGNLSGLAAGQSVGLRYNNNLDYLVLNADGPFTFDRGAVVGSTYDITIGEGDQPADQICTVANGSGTADSAVTDVEVNCAVGIHTIGGTLSGLADGGGVTLRNNGGDNLSLTENGSFTFATLLGPGNTYNVTVSTDHSTQTCSVTNGSGTVMGDVSGVQVTCLNLYTIGGTLSGVPDGQTVGLQNNGGNDLWRSSDGDFSFTEQISHGSPYEVTVFDHPPGKTCSVNNGTGIATADVTNVEVTCLNSCPAGGVIHVDQKAAVAGDGASWATALRNLQVALNFAAPCEVWVAAGVYKPVTPANTGSVTLAERDASFEIKNAFSIYGGFAGTETARAQRDPQTHLTVLSGDIDNNDTSDGNGVVVSADDIVGPNSFSVIVGGVGGSNPLSTAVLDGFTITAGRANGAQGIHRAGGGMRIRGSATLTGLHFRGNFADTGGGLVEAPALGPGLTLTRVSFSGNSAGTRGGGMATFDSNPTLINVSFSGNSALGEGGGFFNSAGFPTLTNVSFSGNSAASGGGIFSEAQSPVISNSIFWNNRDATGIGTPRASIDNRSGSNPQISHSLVQGCNPGGVWDALCGINGGGNLGDADPLFVSTPDPANAPTDVGNLGLLPTSPAIDLGDNIANGSSFDLAGNPRIVNGVIDLGGYEYAGRFDCPAGDIVHVGKQATQAPDGRSWASAFEDLQLALAVEGPCEIRVAAGTYKPGVLRADSFLLKDGVAIYGGFPADGGNWEDRDWDAHETNLSGDIDNSGTLPGNSYHVVLGSGNDETAVLDGVTVTGGFADANGDNGEGGGMRNVSASPTITNVVFRVNYADRGGGMYNHDGSHPVLTNVLFIGNLAEPGAGMFNSLGSSPALINVSFSGNNATEGGAIFNSDSSPTLVNVIMWNNLAGASTGTASASIFNSGTSNPTIAHSLIANCNPGSWVDACGINGGNNLADADPLFVDTPDPSQVPVVAGDLRLRARSPAIDAGDSAVNPTALDLGGIARLFGPGIDLGAYETAYLSASLSSAGSGAGNASVQSPLPARFEPGDSVTVTAAPAASSNFTGWTGDLTAADNTLVFTINNDTALTANFVLKTFEVIASESGNGTITPSSQTVDYDGTASFTVTPDAGWSIDSVSGDSCDPVFVNGDQWHAVNIVENCTVDASFAINYAVGGEVSGLQGTGLALDLNGIETLAIGGLGLFSFATELAAGSNYTVTISAQPGNPAQTCSVANGSGTLEGADVTDIAVTCVTDQFMIGGTVTGLAGSGLVLQNNGGDDLPIAGNGTFGFSTALDDLSAFNVTVASQPLSPIQFCSVSNGSGTLGGSNIVDVVVDCEAAYTVGGIVTGLQVPGLVLDLNGTSLLLFDQDSSYTFSAGLPDGGEYSVTAPVAPDAHNCTLFNAIGSIGGSNVTDVDIVCVTDVEFADDFETLSDVPVELD